MSSHLRVGLLLLVAGTILILGIFFIGDQEGVWKSKYTLRIKYADVYGLLPGAPVRLAGLRIGSVSDICFCDAQEESLLVTISVDQFVQDRIRKNSEAIISTLGLLGDKTIEISTGSFDQPRIEENGFITSGKSTSIEALFSQGGDAMENLKDASLHAKEIIEKINKGTGTLGLLVNDPDVYFNLDELLRVTKNLTSQLESGKGSFAKFIKDPKFYNELTRFLETTNSSIDSLMTGEGTLGMLMRDPKPYEDLRDMIASWKDMTARIQSGEGTAGMLLTNDSLYINLSRTLDRTEALLKDFRENPGRYIKFRIF